MRTLAILFLVGVALAAGAAGTLDSTFDGDGLVETPEGIFLSVVVQPDGKIVAVGDEVIDNQTGAFVVARYNADGSLDTTFGTDGLVRPFDDDSSADGNAKDVALDASGRILVLGGVNFDRETGKGKKKKIERVWAIALVRLDTNGSLDSTFGDGGKALFETLASGEALALQADGKIVAAGAGWVRTRKKGGGRINDAVVLVRFHADGGLDTGFGTDGMVFDNPTDNDERPHDVGLQSDGRIVVVGPGFMRRYETNGDVDATLGGDGLVETAGLGYSIAIDASDRILLAGSGYGWDGIVARYDADGALDTDFAEGGRYTTGEGRLSGLSLLGDGRIVACGNTYGQDGFVLRLTSGGSEDLVSDLTTPGDGVWEAIIDLAVDPDGNYVICGVKNDNFFLARYCGN